MLNMPVSEEDLLHHCKRFQKYMKANGYLSYKDLLVIEAGITEDMYKMIAEETESVPESESKQAPVEKPPVGKTPVEKPPVETKGGSRRLKRSSLSSSRKKRKSQPLSR
jgi:hypothetical protein